MASGVSGTSSIPVTIKTVSRIVGGLADLTQKLQRAISAGDVVQAQQVATLLAEQHANVSLNVQMEGTPRSNLDKDIQVKVYVEDRESSGVCIGLTLKPSMTIEQLKNKMMLEYSFIPEVQRWIIGKKIVKDTDTLARCGVRGNDMPVFLYLVSAASIGLTPEETRRKYGHLLPHLLPQVCNIPAATSQVPTVEPLPAIAAQRSPTIPPLPPVEQPRLQERQTPERAQTTNEAESDSSNGWVCGKCTYITLWTREACDMCHTDRPANLHPPVNYKIPVDEQRRLEHLEELERLAKQLQKTEEAEHLRDQKKHFQQLRQADEQDLIKNTQPFECSICFSDINADEGVMLRECLHVFCRDCLQGLIKSTDRAEVLCPYRDNHFSCPMALQHREIKALVSVGQYQRFLQRSVVIVETQAANSFHCKFPDCTGWCFYEDTVNVWHCPVCKKKNCLTCKAIHENQTCREYQVEIELNASTDTEAHETYKKLKELILSGEAMQCPSCQIIILKKEGCDWVQCSMCLTEICWVTHGPRWGPQGLGDISSGCQCLVNDIRCHPDCVNCH